MLVKFLTRDPASSKVVEQAVYRSIDDMLGKFGSADTKARMIGFDETTGKAVFRCKTGSAENLRAVLALMTEMHGKPAAAMVVRSSGTIKALRVRLRRNSS